MALRAAADPPVGEPDDVDALDLRRRSPPCRVRGVCYHHEDEKSFGFIRYLSTVDAELWRTDTHQPGSPYRTVFCHDSELPEPLRGTGRLPSRDVVLEFRIAEGEQGKGNKAVEVIWVNPRPPLRGVAPIVPNVAVPPPPPPANGGTTPDTEPVDR